MIIMNNKNKFIFIVFCLILLIGIFSVNTFSKLQRESKINYKTKTGNMICEYDIDQNDSYIEDGIKYILVNVKNYKVNSNGETNISDVDVKYSLTIKNKDNSNGVYKWEKVGSSDDSSDYLEVAKTNTYTFKAGSEETSTFKIYIQLNNQNISQNVNLDVELNAEQAEKKTTFESEE